ncbi:hypothetical protein CBS133816_2065 [Aspergillus niger]|nr:hypothetical protein CBS133816_2065 [Aspergillus niger]
MQPLLLHAHASGPNPIKIAIALEALNTPYNVKLWEFGNDREKGVRGEVFLRINENGRVPALEDPNTGVVSWESGACMNYVRRVYDKENFLGPKGSEQDIVDFEKWEYFLLSTLGPMTGQTNWYRHYNGTKNEDALQRYSAQTERCYGVLEGQLKKSGGQSVLPGRITAVDYHFEPWVREYDFAGLSLEKYPLITQWLRVMTGRKEVQQAYIKIQGAAPQFS